MLAMRKQAINTGKICKTSHVMSDCESMQFAKRQENKSKHLPACLGYKTSKAALNMCKLLRSFCQSVLILLRKYWLHLCVYQHFCITYAQRCSRFGKD